ncbi:hypothetical protein IV203_027525 [Nitzschia inconspicua]|uniref:Uncharacterized protein n=1 Tax=Nitzschia inconspicua TaxID=303405 RepID=A0A9K3Q651_9STRA|nr:hypothetical protein IV203_027525 [Nitzschia inconspicua]
MDAVLAQMLAREAVKKKPELARVEIEEKAPAPKKEPERLTSLKKAEVQDKQVQAPVNSTPLPKVELKKAQKNERPNVQVNSAPLPKIELKKAEVKERPTVEVNKDPVVKVQLKKAEVKERPSIEVNKEPAVKVQLKKAEVKERPAIEVNASSLPTVQLRKTEVESKPKTPSTDEQPKQLVHLRKPGKGRFRNLEQYYQEEPQS